MTKSMRVFEIFLSSPSDVPQERADVQAVIDDINASGEFSDMFSTIKLHRWDDPQGDVPPSARQNPQETVNKYTILPAECDLVVVIFYMRLGTPTAIAGRNYDSGTDYEYQNALESDKPEIFVYRCTGFVTPDLSDPKFDEKIEQYRKLNQYIENLKQKSLVREYPNHADFRQIFKAHLLKHLRYIRTKKPDMDDKEPQKPPKPRITVPYKGLVALGKAPEDIHIFFGRTSESLDVLARMEHKRLVPIVGASGSGKSSLVMAGVLPALRERGWRVIQCFPSDNPFYQLTKALIANIPEMGIAPNIEEVEKWADKFKANPRLVIDQIELALPNQRTVIYIDQFEEVFTIADRAQMSPFIEAIRQPAPMITTLLTLRADFYETALAHLDDLKQDTYGLKKPSPVALYEMITRPAHDAGYQLDERLAETIITELGDESGALALMAYMMETLYLRAKNRGDKYITQDDYDKLGGVKGAMNTLAENAYHALPFEEKEAVLRRVFFDLITLNQDETGQLVPTRRRADFTSLAPDSPERVLIDRFADARLLVKDGNMVEVAHEAILRHWEQLVGWIDDNNVSIATYRRFERDAKEWASNTFPLPSHDQITPFYNALNILGLHWEDLQEPLKTYTEPETNRLLRELDDINTSHQRRAFIGERLDILGDPRRGIGILDNGIPDIIWCFVDETQNMVVRLEGFRVQPFYVAKYLTTYAQYEAFLKATDGYNNTEWWYDFPIKQREFIKRKNRSKFSPQSNLPRNKVSWYESIAFTRWLNSKYSQFNLFEKLLNITSDKWEIRLPNEAEWLVVAGDKNWYHKDDSIEIDNDSLANLPIGDITQRISAVGMYPHGASCGALDIIGNLYEWFNNIREIPNNPERSYPMDRKRVSLRGGSYRHSMNIRGNLLGSHDDVGFRVAICPII